MYMEFDYKELGNALVWNRKQKNLRQIDLVIQSRNQLKQPTISSMERGETRVPVDALIHYCNAAGIRPDMILEPFILTKKDVEEEEVIVDPYVIQMARVMEGCSPEMKQIMLEIAGILKKQCIRQDAETRLWREKVDQLQKEQDLLKQ